MIELLVLFLIILAVGFPVMLIVGLVMLSGKKSGAAARQVAAERKAARKRAAGL